MFSTYHATLTGDRLKWHNEKPAHLQQNRAVEVHVTILEETALATSAQDITQGQRMADALEQLARLQSSSLPDDPAAWERDIRTDCALPGREA